MPKLKGANALTGHVPKTCSFPDYMFQSQNYFKAQWSMSGAKRRLKNVVMLLEYVPDPSKISVSSGTEQPELTESQTAQLKRVFDLFDINDSGGLSSDELVQLLRANGVNVESTRDALVREIMAQIPSASDGLTAAAPRLPGSATDARAKKAVESELSGNSPMAMLMRQKKEEEEQRSRGASIGGMPDVLTDALAEVDPSRVQRERAWKKAARQVIANLESGKEMGFELIKLMMEQQTFFRIENGRYYVALSLSEAETLRGVMHMRQSKPTSTPSTSFPGTVLRD